MIQLLVHARAPSAKGDDERYRSQARAYAECQGRWIKSGPIADDAATRNMLPSMRDAAMEPSRVANHDTTRILDDTQSAYNALDSQLATSSLRILDGTHSSLESSCRGQSIRASIGHRNSQASLSEDPPANCNKEGSAHSSKPTASQSQHSVVTSDALSPPPDHSHSSYLKSPILHPSKKRRRWSDSPGHRFSTSDGVRSAYPLQSHIGSLDSFNIRRRPLASVELADPVCDEGFIDSNGAAENTSELPTSYSLSDITTDSSSGEVRAPVSHTSRNSPRLESQVSADPQGTAVPIAPKPIHGALEPQSEQNAQGGIPECVSNLSDRVHDLDQVVDDAVVRPALRAESTHATGTTRSRDIDVKATETFRKAVKGWNEANQPGSKLCALRKLVQPPEPKAAVGTFTTHVTDTLRYLLEQLDVERLYRPVFTTRGIDALERGYWLIDCSPLGLDMQIDFWQFIEKTIKSGNAGWGVWCSRGSDYESQVGVADGAVGSIGLIKVFCWGEVVKHIYLMLYVASKAKARKLGLQWIDAEGNVVVQMKKT